MPLPLPQTSRCATRGPRSPPGARTCLLGGGPCWLHVRRSCRARRGTARCPERRLVAPEDAVHTAQQPVPGRGCCLSSVPTKPHGQIGDHGEEVRTGSTTSQGLRRPARDRPPRRPSVPLREHRDRADRRPGGPPRAAAEPHALATPRNCRSTSRARFHPGVLTQGAVHTCTPSLSAGPPGEPAMAGPCQHRSVGSRRPPCPGSATPDKGRPCGGATAIVQLVGAELARLGPCASLPRSGEPRSRGPSSRFGAQPHTGRRPVGRARMQRSRPPHVVTDWPPLGPCWGWRAARKPVLSTPRRAGPPNRTPTALLFMSTGLAPSSESTALLILIFFKNWIRKISSGKLINA